MNFSQMSFDNGILHLANWAGNVIMPTIAALFIMLQSCSSQKDRSSPTACTEPLLA